MGPVPQSDGAIRFEKVGGSGLLLDDNQFLVSTAYHVVEGARLIELEIDRSASIQVTVAVFDKDTDVAILRPTNAKELASARDFTEQRGVKPVRFAREDPSLNAAVVCGYRMNGALEPRQSPISREPLRLGGARPSFYFRSERLYSTENRAGACLIYPATSWEHLRSW